MIHEYIHITYITHILIHIILYDSYNLHNLHNSNNIHNLYNLNNSYNLQNSYNLHNSYNLQKSYNLHNLHVKLVFKEYKNLVTYFLPTYKNVNRILWKNKERLPKKARGRYQNLPEEEKYKKHQYAREQYWNVSVKKKKRSGNMVVNDMKIFRYEDEKQRLVEYMKK